MSQPEMRSARRQFLQAGGALAASALLPLRSAVAQTPQWQSLPAVRIVVPFAPGGSADLIARAFATDWSVVLGKPVVVDNKPGAAATLGGREVAKSAKDGATVLLTTVSGQLTAQLTSIKPGYTLDSFTFISNLVQVPTVLLASAKSKIKTFEQFARHVKQNTHDATYGSSGLGSINHFAGENLLHQMYLSKPLVHVPYRGSGPMLSDLLGGQIAFGFDQLSSAKPFLDQGSIALLGVASKERLKAYPSVPTFTELGFKQMSLQAHYGIATPAGTPNAIVEFYYTSAMQVLKSKSMQERMAALQASIVGSNSAQFTEQLKTEEQIYKGLLASLGITLE